jgi:2-polyprenyl-6-methoxyphenol hydroxylase-like FAD-dependent oxidoreductase
MSEAVQSPAVPDVLVVGAGPTGLALACELAWRRVRVRIVDAARGPVTTSNALGVMPRTLEQLEPHGIVDAMLRRGLVVPRIDMRIGGRLAASIETALEGSRFASLLVLPQRDTEQLLVERLGELGARVEWQTRAGDVTVDDECACVTLRPAAGDGRSEAGDGRAKAREGGGERMRVPWLVACDGVGSTVRDELGIAFEGAAYREAFNLADARIDWPLETGVAHSFLSPAGLFFAVPLPGEAPRFRLIIAEPSGSAAERRPDPDLATLYDWLRERTPPGIAERTTIHEPEWTSRFGIQRRVVPSLRHRRVLLAGDAAHVHSPAGAQGMNTGLQDAANLGWKLAAVLRGEAPDALLDSYDAERLPVARAVIGATHGLTSGVTSKTAATLVGRVLGGLLARDAVRRRVLATTYGMLVQYRRSPIVAGRARLAPLRRVLWPDAQAHAGDRAPDVVANGTRLYDALLHPGMTLLAFAGGDGDTGARALAELRAALDAAPVPVPHIVAIGGRGGSSGADFGADFGAGGDGSGRIGDRRAPAGADAVLADPVGAIRERYDGTRHPLQLIRPDRHVAWRGADFDAGAAAAALVMAYGG